jgi:hypothetical protein
MTDTKASSPDSKGKEGASDNGCVYVETVGGLGNQLFQIAAGLAYARRTNRTCVCRRAPTSCSIMGPRLTYWDTLFNKVKQVDSFPDHVFVHNENESQHKGVAIPEYRGVKSVLLRGYFQSLVFLTNGNVATDWPLLFPPGAIETARKQLHSQISESSMRSATAFIHIRRGDYKSLSHFHPVLPIAYYERASQEYPTGTRYLIFCEKEDAIAVAAEFSASKIFSKLVVQFVPFDVADHIQLLMMALCPRGGIIANSTFSCWSAHLRPVLLNDGEPLFVAPNLWFLGAEMPKILGQKWRRLDSPFTLLQK